MAEYTEIDSAQVRRLTDEADQLLRKARRLAEEGLLPSPHWSVVHVHSDLSSVIAKMMDVRADLDSYDKRMYGGEYIPTI